MLALSLSLACTSLAGIPHDKLVGVYPPDGVLDARNVGNRQYILTGGKVPALVARELATGKTIWKNFIGGGPHFVDRALKDHILYLRDQVPEGEFFPVNQKVTLVNLDGEIALSDFSTYIAQANGMVLVTASMPFATSPDDLYDSGRADFWVVNLKTKQTDKSGFEIPT